MLKVLHIHFWNIFTYFQSIIFNFLKITNFPVLLCMLMCVIIKPLVILAIIIIIIISSLLHYHFFYIKKKKNSNVVAPIFLSSWVNIKIRKWTWRSGKLTQTEPIITRTQDRYEVTVIKMDKKVDEKWEISRQRKRNENLNSGPQYKISKTRPRSLRLIFK